MTTIHLRLAPLRERPPMAHHPAIPVPALRRVDPPKRGEMLSQAPSLLCARFLRELECATGDAELAGNVADVAAYRAMAVAIAGFRRQVSP